MANRILGVLCLILGTAMAWAARSYAAEISYEPVGPRAFPLLLAAILVLIGVQMLVQSFMKRAPASPSTATPPLNTAASLGDHAAAASPATAATAMQGAPLPAPAPPNNTLAVILCAGAVLVYGALFQPLGFVLATAIMTIPVGKAFGGTWKSGVIGGLAMGLTLYFLFDKLLDVVLPTGVLSFIFGGR